MKDFKLTFINYNTKDILDIIVSSTITDAYIHEHGYLEIINTGHPDVCWLTFLAEKQTNQKLNRYNLHSVSEI